MRIRASDLEHHQFGISLIICEEVRVPVRRNNEDISVNTEILAIAAANVQSDGPWGLC